MGFYRLALVLHVTAATLWLGHMFFMSLFAGPTLKKIEPPETADLLREASRRLGGLGWPALAVLIATGAYMLAFRGIGISFLLSTDLLATAYGRALASKLLLVAGMVLYQIVLGHRPAPRAIYLNMLAALSVLAASVYLARG